MPELPEAETIARQLHQHLAGRTLGDVTLLRPDILHGDPRSLADLLPGRVVRRVYRRAKRVVIELDSAARLVIRLGMTGRLTVTATAQPLEPHTHLRIAIGNGKREVRFRDPRRFGGVWLVSADATDEDDGLGKLGAEPLETTPAAFRRLLQRRRQIKALLMDQHVIAGLGNIYCDESLHAAGVHPLTRADALSAETAGRLLRAIKSILRRAIRFQGSTLMDYRSADGAEGSFQRLHRVYQRDGQPCRKCRTTIVRIRAAGRSTFLCPRCQRRRPLSPGLGERAG